MQLGQSLGTFEEYRKQRLGIMASALTNSPEQLRPLIYRSVVSELRQLGLQPPDEYTPEIDAVAQRLAAVLTGQGGTPAQLRYFQAMTQGLPPEEVEQARRVALGIAGRASSAGMSLQKVTGPDGREYVVVFDPRTGQPRPVSMEELFGNLGASPFAGAPSGAPTAAAAPPAQPAAAPSTTPATPPVSAPGTPVASPTPEERKRLEALGTERGKQEAEAAPLPGSELYRRRRSAEIAAKRLLDRA